MTSLKQYPTAAIRVDNVGFFCSKCVSWQGFVYIRTSSFAMQFKYEFLCNAAQIYRSFCNSNLLFHLQCKSNVSLQMQGNSYMSPSKWNSYLSPHMQCNSYITYRSTCNAIQMYSSKTSWIQSTFGHPYVHYVKRFDILSIARKKKPWFYINLRKEGLWLVSVMKQQACVHNAARFSQWQKHTKKQIYSCQVSWKKKEDRHQIGTSTKITCASSDVLQRSPSIQCPRSFTCRHPTSTTLRFVQYWVHFHF